MFTFCFSRLLGWLFYICLAVSLDTCRTCRVCRSSAFVMLVIGYG